MRIIKRILFYPVKLIAITLVGVLFALALQIILALAILLVATASIAVLLFVAILPIAYTYTYLLGKETVTMNRITKKLRK